MLDLLSILDIQPDNSAALAELASLSPRRLPQKMTSLAKSPVHAMPVSISSMASSSSSAVHPSSQPSAPANGPGHGDHSSMKPELFKRTYQDDFKLRISTLPVTIDIPVDLPPPFVTSKDKGKRLAVPYTTSIHTKLESFAYPSWERYVIEKHKV